VFEGGPGGDEADVSSSLSPGDNQESTEEVETDGDVAFLLGMRVVDSDRARIIEDANSISERNPMLGAVASRLAWVPFERHSTVYAQLCTRSNVFRLAGAAKEKVQGRPLGPRRAARVRWSRTKVTHAESPARAVEGAARYLGTRSLGEEQPRVS
jgi:hypothetical protein